MKIIFARHGQTNENAAHTYLGHTDPSLNDYGRQQIHQFVNNLNTVFHENIHSIYTSDLLRALESAHIIGLNLNLPYNSSFSLRELNFGKWEGKTYEMIREENPNRLESWINNPYQMAPPEGESLQDLGERFDGWFQELLINTNDDQNLLIMTHGGPIRWFWSKWILQDPTTFWKVNGIEHGRGLIVQIDKQTGYSKLLELGL